MDSTDKKPRLDLRKVLDAVNITDMLDDEFLENWGSKIVQNYEADDATREGWKGRNKDAMKLALQVVEEKNYPWPGASNVKFPLLSQAALQFQTRAYSNLVKAPDIVRFRVNGADPDGRKAARASRISQHMSYQVLEEDEEWEDGFDRLLMVVPIMGLAFRKKYWSATDEKFRTTTVLPQNLVVPYRAKSLYTTPRITELYELYEWEIKEQQNFGIFREVELSAPETIEEDEGDKRAGISRSVNDPDRPRQILEQHLYEDLDGDGYPEPYIVTVDKSSKTVLRVVQRFRKVISKQTQEISKLEDKLAQVGRKAQEFLSQVPPGAEQDPEMAMQLEEAASQLEQEKRQILDQIKELQQEKPNVLKIEPIHCYIKYSFIPAPDGSFYDLGFGSLLGPLNRTVNTIINQLIDSGTMQNGSQGFLGRGARIKGGALSFKPYEWKRVESTGQSLRESIVPLPVNPPSQVLFSLLGLMIEYTREFSSVTDAMSGQDMGQNTPAYNMQTMVEQGMQVFAGIFKRIWRSMRTEFREQYRLNGVYLNPEEYFTTLDGDAKVLQSDYWGDASDVVPAADPNAFSRMERLMKSQFLAQRAATMPHYDGVQVELRLLADMDIEDIQKVYPLDEEGKPVIPAPSNPEFEVKALEEQRRTLEGKARIDKDLMLAESSVSVDQATVMKMMADIQAKGAEIDLAEFEAITKRIKAQADVLKAKREEIKKDADRGNSGA